MSNQLANLSVAARRAAQRFDWESVLLISQNIISLFPSDAEGYFLQGLAFTGKFQPKVATKAFKKALGLDSGRYDAAIELSNQFSISQENGDAKLLLDNNRVKIWDSPRYLDLAGTVYVNIGLPEKALPLYERAVELQPEIDLFRANLAACSVYLGRIDTAEKIYGELLNKNPSHQRNHYHYSRLKKAVDRTHLEVMLAELKNNGHSDQRNIYIANAIGKEFEDLGEWSLAFEYYKRAGDAATSASKYTIDEDMAIVDTILSHYDEKWMSAKASARSQSGKKTPIFIVSLPRSGSTLTERIIGSHSQVKSLGETQFFPRSVRLLSGVSDQQQISTNIIEAAAKLISMDELAQAYLDSVAYRLGDEPYFIEKLPYNFIYLGLIAKAFPDAKILYIERNPMDVCLAMYKQIFTWAYKYSYDLANLGSYYQLHEKLLAHWERVMPGKILKVSYEKLVQSSDGEIRKLLESLGLPFESTCFNFHESKEASTTASSVQVREKIHQSSVGKWKNFEEHLMPLISALDYKK